MRHPGTARPCAWAGLGPGQRARMENQESEQNTSTAIHCPGLAAKEEWQEKHDALNLNAATNAAANICPSQPIFCLSRIISMTADIHY